jgi:ribosome-associated toxin RatA of RatAB toxin-antitoxin module
VAVLSWVFFTFNQVGFKWSGAQRSDPALIMKTVHKSVLIWFSAQEMYNLVTDIESYPKFLPWCEQGQILETHADGVTAQIGMSIGGFKKSFTTRNVNQLNSQVHLELVQGPFKELSGVWDFHPLDDQRACRIELQLNYRFESVFGNLVGPLFDKIASTLVDAFVKRAEQVYVAT